MNRNAVLWLLAGVVLLSACRNEKTENNMKERGHFEWTKDAVIYEVNIRQYTEEGTFEAFLPHMDRLKEMGVDILWFMPIHPVGEMNRKGGLGSYYSVRDYKGVNPEFGTMDDFKSMVEKAHSLGMKVLLDWVANHTAWDHVWAYTNPEYYTKTDEGGFVSPYDWTDVIELDYSNREMRDSMIDALAFWVKEANIDGYRCDVAGLVPTDFWDDARRVLEQIKPVFMLAEDEDNPDLLRYAFDMNYAWKVHHLMNRIVKKEASPADMISYFQWNDTVFDHSHYRMNFITNHDENSWNGTEFERFGEGVEAFAVFSFLIPGMPLIYSGQEAGLDKRLRFFEKDTINWSNIRYHEFYTRLIGFKKGQPPLHNGRYGAPMEILSTRVPDQLFAFVRKNSEGTVIALFNLSDQPAETKLFNRDDLHGNYSELFSGERVTLDSETLLSFNAWGYKVLYIND